MRRNFLLGSVLLVLLVAVLGVVLLSSQPGASAVTVDATADDALMSVVDPAQLSSIEAFTQELEAINAYTEEEFDWSTVNFENISYG